MIDFFSKIASIILHRDVKLDENLPVVYLLSVMLQRGLMLIRGGLTFG